MNEDIRSKSVTSIILCETKEDKFNASKRDGEVEGARETPVTSAPRVERHRHRQEHLKPVSPVTRTFTLEISKHFCD